MHSITVFISPATSVPYRKYGLMLRLRSSGMNYMAYELY